MGLQWSHYSYLRLFMITFVSVASRAFLNFRSWLIKELKAVWSLVLRASFEHCCHEIELLSPLISLDDYFQFSRLALLGLPRYREFKILSFSSAHFLLQSLLHALSFFIVTLVNLKLEWLYRTAKAPWTPKALVFFLHLKLLMVKLVFDHFFNFFRLVSSAPLV